VSIEKGMANNYTAWVVSSIGASAGAVLFFGVDRFLPGTSIPWFAGSASSGAAEGSHRQVAQLANAVSRTQAAHSRLEGEGGVSKVRASASPPRFQRKGVEGWIVVPSLLPGRIITMRGEKNPYILLS